MKALLIFLMLITQVSAEIIFPTPLDLDWSNLQSITIGGLEVGRDSLHNIDKANMPVCFCGTNVGVPVEFWEAIKIIEVVSTPYQFPILLNMGNQSNLIDKLQSKRGAQKDDSSYHYHIYHWPILRFAKDIQPQLFQCLDQGAFALEYMSEADPSHSSSILSTLLAPEVLAAAAEPSISLAIEGSCIFDAMNIAVNGEPLDMLYYCSGREGSLFPLNSEISPPRGSLRDSYLIAMRALFKMHRLGAFTRAKNGTLDKEAACGPYCQPIMRRHQYKLQLIHPKPLKPLTVFLGEDISEQSLPLGKREFDESVWIVWRKRFCCAHYKEGV